MEDINSNILHASNGHFVSPESPLTEWPTETFAYYSEIKPEDLREGMENIIHVLDSIPKSSGRYASKVINEMGTITAVEFKNQDPTNMYMSITHRLTGDIDAVPSARQYSTFMETANWIQGGKFYQRHMWVRVHPDIIESMPHEAIKGLILRSDNWDGDTVMSIVADSISEDTWHDLKDKIAANKGTTSLYHLYPKPSKVLRQAEAIPPMPGEKPQPADNQPGDGGQGDAQPEQQPDIPPMPGESRQSVDENKRGETTELGEGWWGTGRGEK